MVEQSANVTFLFLSYFADVMLTYERYQALHAINIRVPGEPGNEAKFKSILKSWYYRYMHRVKYLSRQSLKYVFVYESLSFCMCGTFACGHVGNKQLRVV